MTDFFALLHEPRRPWLDPDQLKETFLALSTESHPDRVHQASAQEQEKAQRRYTDLNAAYQRLRDPKERLQHLLELERGARAQQVQSIPADLMDLSLEVARLCREADNLIAQKARTSSPLLQVEIFERGQEWSSHLTALQTQMNQRYEDLVDRLKLLDSEWGAVAGPDSTDRAPILDRLENLSRIFSFVSRWQSQIRERLVQLTF